jgi:L-2,4-diaminobutyric acid acetyltransferase
MDGVLAVTSEVLIAPPVIADGAALWRIARDSGKLDLNSPYAYLLWCRDFAETSVVARIDGDPIGFVIGFRRPDAPDTLLVWQVAVDGHHRGIGLAATMLDVLLNRAVPAGVQYLETTITPDNTASDALFRACARRWRTWLDRSELFPSEIFPDPHETEHLYRIGPLEIKYTSH